MNKTQRLQEWIETHPNWDVASYGEFMHVGANQTLLRVALEGLELTHEMRALDIACAIGGNARWLASLFGCEVSGIDINESELEVARELAEIERIDRLCTFLNARADDLPFADNHFDLAISTDVFDPVEVHRVLKPGGTFIISTYWDDPPGDVPVPGVGLGTRTRVGGGCDPVGVCVSSRQGRRGAAPCPSRHASGEGTRTDH